MNLADFSLSPPSISSAYFLTYFSCDLFPGVAHGNCDIAASSLIVEEAGGKVTDFEGHTQRYDEDINGAIISNGKSHDEVLEYVKGKIK